MEIAASDAATRDGWRRPGSWVIVAIGTPMPVKITALPVFAPSYRDTIQ
jgi:hypothetical protein